MISGLIAGIIFGFLWKRGKFCATGIIRDIYLEKQRPNLVLILAIIFIQAFLYHLMTGLGIIPMAKFKDFPLVSVALGSFMFGFGAVMCNGCITASLVKLGDGRLTGLVSLLFFVFAAYTAKHGFLLPVTKSLGAVTLVPTPAINTQPMILVGISGIVSAVLIFMLIKKAKAYNPKYTLPAKHTGFLHFVCEKVWQKEIIVILMGIVMAAGFYFSNMNGRNGGFGITTPLLSWVNAIISGGKLGWASMLVLGIILGSTIASLLTKEFSFLGTNLESIIKTAIGSVLMGIGAVWGQGCLIGNGLVGTAQFSLKSWWALLFIVIGIWSSAYIFLARSLNKD